MQLALICNCRTTGKSITITGGSDSLNHGAQRGTWQTVIHQLHLPDNKKSDLDVEFVVDLVGKHFWLMTKKQ